MRWGNVRTFIAKMEKNHQQASLYSRQPLCKFSSRLTILPVRNLPRTAQSKSFSPNRNSPPMPKFYWRFTKNKKELTFSKGYFPSLSGSPAIKISLTSLHAVKTDTSGPDPAHHIGTICVGQPHDELEDMCTKHPHAHALGFGAAQLVESHPGRKKPKQAGLRGAIPRWLCSGAGWCGSMTGGSGSPQPAGARRTTPRRKRGSPAGWWPARRARRRGPGWAPPPGARTGGGSPQ